MTMGRRAVSALCSAMPTHAMDERPPGTLWPTVAMHPAMTCPARSSTALVAAGILASAVAVMPSTVYAQRAAYAQPGELPGEGPSYQLDVSVQGRYARVVDSGRVQGFMDSGTFALRSRFVLGRTVGYAAGFDGTLGGGETGAVYGLTVWPVGLGARWGLGSYVALVGGVGVDGVVGAVPLAVRIPAQVTLGLTAGAVRFSVWAGPAWVPGSTVRQNGSSWLPAGDEFEAGVQIRLGRQRRYWGTTNAGGGPSLGVVYREYMAAREIAVVLGIDLSGGK